VPGTPTLIPLTRWASKRESPVKAVGVIAAGAVSRESIVWTTRSWARVDRHEPAAAIPHEYGSTTPSTAAAATAASMALPAARSHVDRGPAWRAGRRSRRRRRMPTAVGCLAGARAVSGAGAAAGKRERGRRRGRA
jgi:hypothetical protein